MTMEEKVWEDKSSHPDLGYAEVEMAMRHLNEKRPIDLRFGRKEKSGLDLKVLDSKGCLSGGLT